MSIKIRNAEPKDRDIIAEFNSRLSAETEDGPLDEHLILPGVAAILSDASKGRYWVAVDGRKLVGQMMVTYEWSDWRNGTLWWLQSVYVHPEYRRNGVFSALYRHVESLARAKDDVVGIRLYVEKNNQRARTTYERMGMQRAGYDIMQTLFPKKQNAD